MSDIYCAQRRKKVVCIYWVDSGQTTAASLQFVFAAPQKAV